MQRDPKRSAPPGSAGGAQSFDDLAAGHGAATLAPLGAGVKCADRQWPVVVRDVVARS